MQAATARRLQRVDLPCAGGRLQLLPTSYGGKVFNGRQSGPITNLLLEMTQMKDKFYSHSVPTHLCSG